MEEMGMKADLTKLLVFKYRAQLGDLVEHEMDHVFVGYTDDFPSLNPDEVSEWRAIPFSQIQEEIKTDPDSYTVWFKSLYEQVHQEITLKKAI